jgi:uncharacterized membrane protein YkoI
MAAKFILPVILLFALFVSVMDAAIAAPSDYRWAGHAVRLAAKQGMSLEQAVAKVQRETGGRILTAETINQNGRAVHRIKVLLPNGKVRVMHVSAE